MTNSPFSWSALLRRDVFVVDSSNCETYLTPNCDIVGIGVRVSVYFQGIFSIILLCFPHADDLIKASFRNAVLTLYAIGIALPVTPDRHSSVEVRVVLHGFINILFISALALMSFRQVIRTWRHIAVFVGTIPLEYWACTATAGGVKHPQCGEFENVSKVSMGSNSYPLYIVLWGTSVGTAVLALPALSMLWFPPVIRRLRRVVLTAALFIWLVTWIFVIVASETSLRDYPYRYRLGFGQIMTLVMLFSQVWDIVYYPFGKSHDGPGQMRRITYWWRTGFKPWYFKHFRGDRTQGLGGVSVIAEKQHQEDRKLNEQVSVDEVDGGTKIGVSDISIAPQSASGVSGPNVNVASVTASEEKYTV